MPTVAVVNQKGGCGKSTTAVHLAWWLASKGQRVRVVDADAQRSSSLWLGALEGLTMPISLSVVQGADDLLEQLPGFAKEVDVVVVDGPAGLSEATRAILLRTDLALVPSQPTGVDLASAKEAVRLVRQAQSVRGGLPRAALFVNRAVRGTRLLKEAREALSDCEGVKLLSTTMHQKQVIADSFGQGAVVWQLGSGAQEAAAEYERLFVEVMEMLK